MPTIDQKELEKFTKGGDRPEEHQGILILALITLAALVAAFIWRRRRLATFAFLLVSVAGCNVRNDEPRVVKLESYVIPEVVVYEPGRSKIDANLAVKNSGTAPVKLLRADGGCSCRRIDQSHFPHVLLPNETLNLDVSKTGGA